MLQAAPRSMPISGIEADVGRDDGRIEGARRVEDAASEERKQVEAEVKAPTPATIAPSGQIVPDDNFEDATR